LESKLVESNNKHSGSNSSKNQFLPFNCHAKVVESARASWHYSGKNRESMSEIFTIHFTSIKSNQNSKVVKSSSSNGSFNCNGIYIYIYMYDC